MASNSKKTKAIRANKRKKAGKERKRISRSKGTTPAFSIHPPKTEEENQE